MIKSLSASVISGAALALVFHPWQLDLMVWIALIPLFWSIYNCDNPSKAALYGWVAGFFFFSLNVTWVYDTLTVHGHFSEYLATIIVLVMIGCLALFTSFFSYISRVARNSGFSYCLIFPTAWVSVEYLRTYALTGFPWDLLGYSLSQSPNLIQIVDITGVYGLSFLIVFVNIAVLEALIDRTKSFPSVVTQLAVGMILIAVCALYGWMKISDYSDRSKNQVSRTVGILQGAIPQGVKWSESHRSLTFSRYEELALESVAKGSELLIWPETSVPVVIGGENLAWMAAIEISKKVNTPMLIGAPSQTDSSGQISYFNSAFLVDGSEILSGYDKIHLVPFGEYMPLNWLFPVGPGMAAREADFTPGTVMTVMKPFNFPAFSVLICYEAIFPELSRMAINNGAQFLVNITNDGWFDTTSAPYQHLFMAKFRSIENRVWLLRAANTGISGAFDPTGRLVDSIGLAESGWINIQMSAPRDVGSFYTKFGDLFAWSCIIVFSMILFWALTHKQTSEGIRYEPIRR